MSTLTQLPTEAEDEFITFGKNSNYHTWMFMGSPWPVVSICAAYLYFVLYLGPRYMKNRQPYDLKYALILYNGYQVLFSMWLVTFAFTIENFWYNIFSSKACRSSSLNPTAQNALSRIAWWYVFSKVVELLDTVFFVLRKKQQQVSFLHVYHHSITLLFAWGYLKYSPGAQGIIIGFLNSIVHVIMYFYYLVAAFGPQYQKYLWWKKYMTKIQLTQFCLMLIYLGYTIVMDCRFSKTLTYLFGGNAVIFLYLFGDFYKKAYREKSSIGVNGVSKVERSDKNGNVKIEKLQKASDSLKSNN